VSGDNYREANQFVRFIELYKAVEGGDGCHFDSLFLEVIASDSGLLDDSKAQLITRLEKECRDSNRPFEHVGRESRRFPAIFSVFREMVTHNSKSDFIQALLMPVTAVNLEGPRKAMNFSVPEAVIQTQKEIFLSNHWMKLGPILDGDLLAEISSLVQGKSYRRVQHLEVGEDLNLSIMPVLTISHYLLTFPPFMAYMAKLLGRDTFGVKCFVGRIYKMRPWVDKDLWHSDVLEAQGRVLALSLSLKPRLYVGGRLQLRESTKKHPTAAPHIDFGELLVFRIKSGLEHRVQRAYGFGQRINLAGWMCERMVF